MLGEAAYGLPSPRKKHMDNKNDATKARTSSACDPPFAEVRERAERLVDDCTRAFEQLDQLITDWREAVEYYPMPEETVGACLMAMSRDDSQRLGMELSGDLTPGERVAWLLPRLERLLENHAALGDFLTRMQSWCLSNVPNITDVQRSDYDARKRAFRESALAMWADEIVSWAEESRESL
jgi:hypothetical protein